MSADISTELLQEAEKISSVIATARRLIADGKTVDLSNLEGKIQALCESAGTAELTQPAPIRNALATIVEDLNTLGDEITSQNGSDGIPSLEDSIKRAINAYGLDGGENQT